MLRPSTVAMTCENPENLLWIEFYHIDSLVSNIIKQHGINSSHAVRAYASSNDAENAHVYTPLSHSYWNVIASIFYCFDIIDLPVPGITDLDTGRPDVPPMLVVICNLPNEEPKVIGNNTDGYCLVSMFYFVINEAMLEALKDVELTCIQ